MPLTKENADNLQKKFHHVIPDLSIKVDGGNNNLSVLSKGIKLSKDLLSLLTEVESNHVVFLKRSGNKFGIYIS